MKLGINRGMAHNREQSGTRDHEDYLSSLEGEEESSYDDVSTADYVNSINNETTSSEYMSKRILEQSERIAQLETIVKSLQRKCQRDRELLKKLKDKATERESNFDTNIHERNKEKQIQDFVNSNFEGNKRQRCMRFADYMINRSPHAHFLLRASSNYLQKNVLPAWKILREMDYHGGVLSYEGLEVLRAVEMGKKRYYRGGVIVSPASLKRIALQVHKIGRDLLPFSLGQTQKGYEYISFKPTPLLLMVLKSYKLGAKSLPRNYSIGLSQSIDGAMLSKNLNHVCFGLKMNDPSAICPLTKESLLQNVQSRNQVFPIKIVMC